MFYLYDICKSMAILILDRYGLAFSDKKLPEKKHYPRDAEEIIKL